MGIIWYVIILVKNIDMKNNEVPQRLQKILAQHGYGSRRSVEELIKTGKVFVNGEVAELGVKATSKDKITVNGVNLRHTSTATHQCILYNKPVGQICTRSDPEGRETVFSALPPLDTQRWIAVGRLDINSSGLLLFTTDGDLANKLMHPKQQIEREYAVRVLGTVTPNILQAITTRVILPDGSKAKFKRVKYVGGTGANSWYNVVLTQGRYREVRQIWQSQGLQVSRLMRIRYGDVWLPRDLPEGAYLPVDVDSLWGLLEQ